MEKGSTTFNKIEQSFVVFHFVYHEHLPLLHRPFLGGRSTLVSVQKS